MIAPYNLAGLKTHFPSQRPPTSGTFELALACCGGTSTGAYVAGVLDFLWEAFEEWRAAANAGTAPNHSVVINNLVGASAGGLSLGLAAMATVKQFPHVYNDALWNQYRPGQPQPKLANPHYRAWVLEINLDRLLSHPDEVETGQIYLFHGAPAAICTTIFQLVDAAPLAKGRDFVRDPLELRATIGNLRGVPYSLAFNGLGGLGVTTEWYEMHRDNIGFALNTSNVGGVSLSQSAGAPDCYDLGSASFPPPGPDPGRDRLREAMVCTSAIPIVFAVTEINQDPDVYSWRGCYWDTSLKTAVVEQPAWTPPDPSRPFNYAATDGGVFDNRPFDVAHDRLAGVRGKNPQSAMKADRAVILIDPLADDAGPPPTNPIYGNIFSVIAKLVLSPVLQCRLDTVDLAQINNESIFSRFIITPSRPSPTRPNVAWRPSQALLSAPMSAFLGFAAEAYRQHDFELGRRNAQWFLKKTLMLPKDHPLFAGTTGWLSTDEDVVDKIVYRPLVPLRGRAADTQPLPDWNWQALKPADIDRYVDAAGKRADAIFKNLKTTVASGKGGMIGALMKIYLSIGWALGGRSAVLKAFRGALTNAQASLDPASNGR